MYSYALKRRSRLNIVLGGLCGGMPPLIGWAAVTTDGLWTMGAAMAGLVFIWIPMHIWALTLHFRDDYARVGVPMLTAVMSEGASARIIAASTVMMVAFSMAPLFIGEGGAVAAAGGGDASGAAFAGGVYMWTAAASGALMVALSGWVVARPTEKAAWVLFKFSSPYLAVLFIALMVDSALL